MARGRKRVRNLMLLALAGAGLMFSAAGLVHSATHEAPFTIVEPGNSEIATNSIVHMGDRVSWGLYNSSLMRLDKIDDDTYELTIDNRLVQGPDTFHVNLQNDELLIRVTVAENDGNAPDEFMVLAMNGWIASPDWVTLPDGQSTTVTIQRFTGM